MKAYKNIIYFTLFVILFYFMTEILVNNIIDNEDFSLWKTLAISFISALGIVYIFFKNPKDFTIERIKAKQKRVIKIAPQDCNANLAPKIIEQLKAKRFKILLSDTRQIQCKSKKGISYAFGEKYVIHLNKNEIVIESVLKYNIPQFDLGVRYEQVNLIEKEIRSLCKETAN